MRNAIIRKWNSKKNPVNIFIHSAPTIAAHPSRHCKIKSFFLAVINIISTGENKIRFRFLVFYSKHFRLAFVVVVLESCCCC